jgi:hypothetical protein
VRGRRARRVERVAEGCDYPTLVELADDLSEDDPDGLFQFGFEIWLRGMGALAKRPPAAS